MLLHFINLTRLYFSKKQSQLIVARSRIFTFEFLNTNPTNNTNINKKLYCVLCACHVRLQIQNIIQKFCIH